MEKIKLPIFHHTDNSYKLKECGIDYSIQSMCEIRDVIFLQINAISEYFEGDNNYTSIHANGTEYICSMNIQDVLKLLIN